MTVAQHERIVAEKDAEISALHHLCDDRFNEIAELRAQPARQVGGGEIELFEGWFNDPNSADNNKQYTLCIEDMRQLARDIARSAWQARAALTPAAAVMPDRKPEREALTDHWRENYEAGEADGYNEALDDVARLNRRAIPAGLLEKIAGTGCDPDCCIAYWRNELRALLGKDGE